MTPSIALQLYTLRDEMGQDFEGTLRKVAEMGYQGVEIAGTGGRSAADVRRLLDELGLRASGAHVAINQLEEDLDQALDDVQTMGGSFVVIPWLPPERRGSAADFVSLGEQLNAIGAVCKERGLQLCYHNHDFEFQQFDGKYALDMLYEQTDPELVKAEIDIYWVQYAGLDPVAYVAKYASRTPLVHLKDMANDETRFFAEIGEGTIDIDGVIAVASSAEWLIVEQDRSRRSPLESVKMSVDHLREKGYLH